MVLGALHWNGLGTTLTIESNMYNTTISNQKLPLCHVEFHKDPFLDPYYSSYIQMICLIAYQIVKQSYLLMTLLYIHVHQIFKNFINPPTLTSKQLDEWFRSNKLSLNVSKTHYVVFSHKQEQIPDNINIRIRNEQISRKEHVQFLGMHIDEK